jgi:hypothetical protein
VVDLDANLHRLCSIRQNDRPADLRTALVSPTELMTWWERLRAEGDDWHGLVPPKAIACELERLELLVEFDEADFAELVDDDLATARERRSWAIRGYRRWRQEVFRDECLVPRAECRGT